MESISKKSIIDLEISYNPTSWGPLNGEKLNAFGEIPYAHFDKKDRISRIADFNQHNQLYHMRNQRSKRDDNVNAEFNYKHDAIEDSTFQLVDTTSKTSKNNSGKKTWGNQMGNRNMQRNTYNNRNNKKQDLQVMFNSGKNFRNKAGPGMNQKGRGKPRRIQKADRAPSLAVSSDWLVVEEFDLSQLLKLVANAPKAEDLVWCGHLDQYDESYEKINSRAAKPLKKVENKVFYSVTTNDDPVMEGFLVEDIGDIYATDVILSHLVAASRSIYSWDVVIEKTDGKIFLDKRENSDFDLLTVSETSQDPPVTSEELDEYNHPGKLSIEATVINQNYSQQILRPIGVTTRKKFEPNPFFAEDDEGEPAAVAYRYRKFTLGNIRLIVRCELHGWVMKGTQESNFTCYALNEWDCKYSGGMNWRQKIDQQPGAVLGNEIKNNSCKLAKWAVQSLLADADIMKIGYVSRVAPNNPFDHMVLGTQSFKPKEFATQINLSPLNVWGIIKMFCELLTGKEDGKYVLIKDPNKSTVRLYSVPPETFENEDKDSDNEILGDDDFDASDKDI